MCVCTNLVDMLIQQESEQVICADAGNIHRLLENGSPDKPTVSAIYNRGRWLHY